MSLEAARQQLEDAHRVLHIQWDRTQHEWSDAKSAEFEVRFITPLSSDVRRAMEGLEQLDQLIKETRQKAGPTE